MKNQRPIKISAQTRELHEQRDRSLDNDPDAPTLPLEAWEQGSIGKYYRPIKSQITTRINADINSILREAVDRDWQKKT